MNVKIIVIGIVAILIAVSVGVLAYSFVDQTEYKNVTFPATVEAFPVARGVGGVEYELFISNEYIESEPETFDFDWLFPNKQGSNHAWWDLLKTDGIVVQATLQYEEKEHTCEVDLGTFSSVVDSYKDFDIEFKNVEILNEYEYGTDAAYTLSAKLISGGNTIINAEFFDVYLLDDSNPPDIVPDDSAPEYCLDGDPSGEVANWFTYTGDEQISSFEVATHLSWYDVEWTYITHYTNGQYGDAYWNPDGDVSGEGKVFFIEKGDRINIICQTTDPGCFHISNFEEGF